MREKILTSVRSLALDPFQGKKLEGDLYGRYSFRVWPYRIIYRIDRNIITVTVTAIGHRQGVYK